MSLLSIPPSAHCGNTMTSPKKPGHHLGPNSKLPEAHIHSRLAYETHTGAVIAGSQYLAGGKTAGAGKLVPSVVQQIQARA